MKQPWEQHGLLLIADKRSHTERAGTVLMAWSRKHLLHRIIAKQRNRDKLSSGYMCAHYTELLGTGNSLGRGLCLIYSAFAYAFHS